MVVRSTYIMSDYVMAEEIYCVKCNKFLGYAEIESFRGNYDATFYCMEHKP